MMHIHYHKFSAQGQKPVLTLLLNLTSSGPCTGMSRCGDRAPGSTLNEHQNQTDGN